MYEVIIRDMSWEWDRARNLLWWRVRLTDGRSCAVGIPLAHVALTFQQAMREPDVTSELPASMGAIDILGDIDIMAPESVDGFLSGIKKAFKKASRGVKKAVRKTTKRLAKTGMSALKTARGVVRSKYMGYGLGALSMAMPAVGGPALAAWAVAKRADAVASHAQKIAKQLGVGGRPNAQQRAVLARAQRYAANARRLASSNAPAARMLMAGLRSF
jgi:hypothetical protein